jgi:hypothetical protein
MTDLPELPPRPVLGPIAATELRRLDAARRQARAEARAVSAVPMVQDLYGDLAAIVVDVNWKFSVTALAEIAVYNQKVRAYNAVIFERKRLEAEAAQAARNAAEIERMRAAACPRCFTTHAGEC